MKKREVGGLIVAVVLAIFGFGYLGYCIFATTWKPGFFGGPLTEGPSIDQVAARVVVVVGALALIACLAWEAWRNNRKSKEKEQDDSGGSGRLPM